MQVLDYIFNIGGNFKAKIDGMTEATGKFSAEVQKTEGFVNTLASRLAAINFVSDYFGKLNQTFDGLSQSGIKLDSQMHDLSAVAGVTGEGLKEIERYARASAKAFGTDAGVAVEGYKLLLSQLSPELGKYPEALQKMGNSIQTTSKLMGNDGVAAAEVLTTAMNQYGVSLEDPMKASEEMARMMNVMAAAGQEGSAELPAIKVALEQCGMAAKAANVSFEETNAAIQVLDKAGRKGSEGGVALRNTLSVLSQGRFLPKDTIEELQKAGVNVLALGDKSKSLHDRLQMLKPVLNDDALFSKLFGRENANAARALVQGTDALADFTEAVTGTSSAEEQAAIVMDSYAERQARMRQKFEDIKISIFQATQGLTMWIGFTTEALVPVSQMIPLIEGLGKMMLWVKSLQWGALLQTFVKWGRQAAISIALMNSQQAINNGLSLGFVGNIGRMTIQLVRFATVGVLNAIKGLGSLALSFITTGAASTGFAAIASASFAAFRATAVSACRAVGIAIMNIPIVGWIAAGITAVIVIIQQLWDKCKGFRVAVFTTLELFKRIGELVVIELKKAWQWLSDLWNSCVEWVTGTYNSVVTFFSSLWESFMSVVNNIKERVSAVVKTVKSAFVGVYASITAYLGKIWGKVSGVVERIKVKLSTFLKPVVDACREAYNGIKKIFNSLFTWIEDKINSVLSWFIDLYNKIAKALGWSEIKARGQVRAAASWEKDHPKDRKDPKSPKSPSGGAGLPEIKAPDTKIDPTAGTLAKGGEKSGSDKIRNITVNIEKLVDHFTVQTTNLHESAERTKEVVTNALLSALNDVNLAY